MVEFKPSFHRTRLWSDDDISYLTSNYHKLDIKSISAAINRTSKSIQAKADLLGITVSMKRTVNSDFFKVWSSDMAWVLGYVLADGCVANDRLSFNISSKDIELLHLINGAMGSTYKVCIAGKSKFGGVPAYLCIRDKGMYRSLVDMGVQDMRFPNVPSEFIWDFIRGYFDGDGCITKSGNDLIVSFCDGSISFLQNLRVHLISLGFSNIPNICNAYIGRGLTLNYSKKTDIQRFYDMMYRDIEGKIYLRRKYDKFRLLLNKPTL